MPTDYSAFMPISTINENRLLKNVMLLLPLISFLAIRITHYRGGESDSLFYMMAVLLDGLILEADIFLVHVLLSIILVTTYYIFSLYKRKNILLPLAGLLAIWVYILVSFRGLFSTHVYVFSSLPYFIFTVVALAVKLKEQKSATL